MKDHAPLDSYKHEDFFLFSFFRLFSYIIIIIIVIIIIIIIIIILLLFLGGGGQTNVLGLRRFAEKMSFDKRI